MSVIVADKNGVTDGSAFSLLQQVSSPIPIVLVAWSENFVFNDELINVGDCLLACYCEYGHDWDLEKSGSHIWGINSEKFPRYYNGDWIKFDNWVKENNPKLLLKRELLKQDVSDTILPIEYVTNIPIQEPQTKEQFLSRPIKVLNYWGRSNEERLRIHAEIWLNAYKNGGAVCDNIYYLNNFLLHEWNNNWATFNIPHYARVDISEIMKISAMSKIGLSMAGAGLRCFRHGEVSTNSVMATEENSLAWSFDWQDSYNCIKFEKGKEIETINRWLYNQEFLYEIYRTGIETAKKYYLPNYLIHLEKTINERL